MCATSFRFRGRRGTRGTERTVMPRPSLPQISHPPPQAAVRACTGVRAAGQWFQKSGPPDSVFLGRTNRGVSVDFVVLFANPLTHMLTRDALFSVRFRTATFR